MRSVARYHPLLVSLHWLLAVLIIAMLGIGFFVLGEMPNSEPRKIDILLVHMSVGMLILLLMVIRIVVRWRTAKPAGATMGPSLFDRIVPILHGGFYLLVLLMVASGYATGILAGLNRIVFQHTGEALPASFASYPTFEAHAVLAILLAGLIALHVLAALYHQFVKRDGLFRRMWFGRRSIN